jgi:hypothetical protein
VRKGPIDVKQLFQIEDVTDAVAEAYINTPAYAEQYMKIQTGKIEPEILIHKACKDCPYYHYCGKDVPEYSVFDLLPQKDADVFYADSELLNKFEIEILNGNFDETINYIDEEKLNFFYFDPPYRPLSSTSSFNSFVKEDFNDDSQRELFDFCQKLSAKNNVLWMLSNSDCSAKNPEDTFFENLYEGFNIQRVYASRAVNANPNKRGKLTELLIRNYNTQSKELIAI